jgi:imidazolonepropionase-like amidohydrolase
MLKCLGLALCLISFCAPAFARPRQAEVAPTPPKLIKAGRILDVRTGKYFLNQGILTDDDRIKEIGPWDSVRAHAPKGVVTIDLSQATLVPGLIDCHAHLVSSMRGNFSGGENITIEVTLMSPTYRVLMGAHNAKEALEAGITSARVVGHSGVDGDVALRDAINDGLVPGPRLQASARKLAPVGGQAVYLQAGIAEKFLPLEFLTVSGPAEARKAVEENRAIGADFIKIVVDAGAGPNWSFRYMAPEDAKAIVDDAHRLGMKVAAHAVDRTAIQTAIDAGVDSIEHGNDATDEQLTQMKQKGIVLDATDLWGNGRILEYYSKFYPATPEITEDLKKADDHETARAKDRLRRAMKIGVKIVMGSDMWSLWPGKTRGEATLYELDSLQKEGMSNIEIVRSSTMNASELMGWSDKVGELAAGKFADIIAVNGDPLQDITTLEHARFVMKGAEIVKNDFTASR